MTTTTTAAKKAWNLILYRTEGIDSKLVQITIEDYLSLKYLYGTRYFSLSLEILILLGVSQR